MFSWTFSTCLAERVQTFNAANCLQLEVYSSRISNKPGHLATQRWHWLEQPTNAFCTTCKILFQVWIFLKTLKIHIFVCNKSGVKLFIAQKLQFTSEFQGNVLSDLGIRDVWLSNCFCFFLLLFLLFRIFLDYSTESLVLMA